MRPKGLVRFCSECQRPRRVDEAICPCRMKALRDLVLFGVGVEPTTWPQVEVMRGCHYDEKGHLVKNNGWTTADTRAFEEGLGE